MKVLLFLYPIVEYVEILMTDVWHEGMPRNLDRLNCVIEQRYRQQGYQVYWLLFGQTYNPGIPNKEALSGHFQFAADDHFVSNGITFFQMLGGSYPVLMEILDHLPEEISELRIGGYHQWDCVDRIACLAHRLGIPTMVDEDLTELYFTRMAVGEDIPDHREFTLKGFGLTPERFSPDLYASMIRRRAGSPWFVQA